MIVISIVCASVAGAQVSFDRSSFAPSCLMWCRKVGRVGEQACDSRARPCHLKTRGSLPGIGTPTWSFLNPHTPLITIVRTSLTLQPGCWVGWHQVVVPAAPSGSFTLGLHQCMVRGGRQAPHQRSNPVCRSWLDAHVSSGPGRGAGKPAA